MLGGPGDQGLGFRDLELLFLLAVADMSAVSVLICMCVYVCALLRVVSRTSHFPGR